MSSHTLVWEQVRQEIQTYFINNWDNHLQYFFEGEGPDMTTQEEPFVSFELQPSRIAQMALLGENPPKRSYGQLMINIVIPDGVGAKVRLEAIDKLIDMFCAKSVGVVIFQDTTVLGVVDGKGWRSQLIIASLYFEQTV